MALGQKIKEIASSKPPPLATGSKKKKPPLATGPEQRQNNSQKKRAMASYLSQEDQLKSLSEML